MNKMLMFLRHGSIWQAMALIWILSECAAMFLFTADGVVHQLNPVNSPWMVLLVWPIGISIATGLLLSLSILGSRYLANRRKERSERVFVIILRKEAEFLGNGTHDLHYAYRAMEKIAKKIGIPLERARELAIKEGGPYALLGQNQKI